MGKKKGRPAKYDWDKECLAWMEYKDGNPDTNLTQYCRDLGMPYDTTRRAFKRRKKQGLKIDRLQNRNRKKRAKKPAKRTNKTGQRRPKRKKYDWEELKADFFAGDYDTLSEFAKAHEIKPKSGNFQKHTAGWLVERAELRRQQERVAMREISDRLVVKAEASALALMNSLLIRCKVIRRKMTAADESIDGELDVVRAVDSTVSMGKGIRDVLIPGIREFRRDKSVDDVFTRYEGGKIDAATACTEIDRLKVPVPESLMMLAKKAPPPEEAEPEWALPDDEELERRFKAGQEAADRQETEFVPMRAAEVKQMKDDNKAKDSFAPEVTGEGVEE
jgi:hypothetical protein